MLCAERNSASQLKQLIDFYCPYKHSVNWLSRNILTQSFPTNMTAVSTNTPAAPKRTFLLPGLKSAFLIKAFVLKLRYSYCGSFWGIFLEKNKRFKDSKEENELKNSFAQHCYFTVGKQQYFRIEFDILHILQGNLQFFKNFYSIWLRKGNNDNATMTFK